MEWEQVMSELEKNENINKDECPLQLEELFSQYLGRVIPYGAVQPDVSACCIPVVTIPAAITAMHHVFVRVAGEKSQVLKKMPCRYSNGNSEDPYSQGF